MKTTRWNDFSGELPAVLRPTLLRTHPEPRGRLRTRPGDSLPLPVYCTLLIMFIDPISSTLDPPNPRSKLLTDPDLNIVIDFFSDSIKMGIRDFQSFIEKDAELSKVGLNSLDLVKTAWKLTKTQGQVQEGIADVMWSFCRRDFVKIYCSYMYYLYQDSAGVCYNRKIR